MVEVPSHLERPGPSSFSLRLFTKSLRMGWLAIFALTVLSEVYPIPLLPPPAFYSLRFTKLLLFLALGYTAPLAFRRFDALNRGILLAAGSASVVEGMQGILGHGHSFHWYELVVKLVLILFGFIVALEAVHSHNISIGPLRVMLVANPEPAKSPTL